MKTLHSTTTPVTGKATRAGSSAGRPPSPLPETVAKLRPDSHSRWARNADRVKTSSTTASTAARAGSFWAPTTAKKISVDSTPPEPPRTSGLPKSAIDSMKPIRNALASPGAISGSDTLRKVRQRSARRVWLASSIDGLTPSTTPISTRNEIGVKLSTWAIQIPVRP